MSSTLRPSGLRARAQAARRLAAEGLTRPYLGENARRLYVEAGELAADAAARIDRRPHDVETPDRLLREAFTRLDAATHDHHE